MKKINKLTLGLALTLCHSTFAAPSFAATATTNFPVSATVIDSCTVSASPFDFGSYNGLSMTVLDASGAIEATCTFGTLYSIALDAGLGSAATLSTRKLTGPAGAELLYGLFTDAPRTIPWGDGTGGTGWVSDTGNGVSQPVTVYGRIAPGQAVAPGAYTDTVTVTLTY
ncbi:MAG: spore coat U domain-containing protein [Usitatibacteraceae bacterium]